MSKRLETVKLPLGSRSYEIVIGSGAIRAATKGLASNTRSKKAYIVADEALTVARAATRSALVKAGWHVHEIAVPAGEGLKEIGAVYPIYGELLQAKADRDSVLFAVGGGTVGDAAGFVAATYLRGIRWVSVPTTLLAQVDSGIGGKTGINHALGKNLIGAFHQPARVVCDTDFLATLGTRDRVSGLGEVVKCALTYDKRFFAELEAAPERFLGLEPRFTAAAIRRTVAFKCKAVARDELDRTGAREVLNFGHTFAHALEAETGYREFRHGEAVLWGLRFAVALSTVRRRLSDKDRSRIDAFLRGIAVPVLPSGFTPARLAERMKQDKKVRDGRVNFVLLDAIGRAVSDNRVTESDLAKAFALMSKGGA